MEKCRGHESSLWGGKWSWHGRQDDPWSSFICRGFDDSMVYFRGELWLHSFHIWHIHHQLSSSACLIATGPASSLLISCHIITCNINTHACRHLDACHVMSTTHVVSYPRKCYKHFYVCHVNIWQHARHGIWNNIPRTCYIVCMSLFLYNDKQKKTAIGCTSCLENVIYIKLTSSILARRYELFPPAKCPTRNIGLVRKARVAYLVKSNNIKGTGYGRGRRNGL